MYDSFIQPVMCEGGQYSQWVGGWSVTCMKGLQRGLVFGGRGGVSHALRGMGDEKGGV